MTLRSRAVVVLVVAATAMSSCSDRKTATPTATTTGLAPMTTAPAPPATTESATTTVAVTVPLRSNQEIAATITRTERGLRAAGTSDDQIQALAEEQQRAYRAAASDAARADNVVALVSTDVRPAARANVTAGVELRALTKPRPSLPPWHIVAPAPASELLAYYREAERRYGVGWEYLAAVHLTETRMGRIRGDSTAGARGPMQFLPSTWKQYGEGGDIESNHDAILAAARLLKHNGAPSRMNDALFSYNRSAHYVTAVTMYAGQMRADERAYAAYHHWQVWYRMTTGDVLLPVGYPESPAVSGGG